MARDFKFKQGDRVQVVSECQSYGQIGTVIGWYLTINNTYYYVQLDDEMTKRYNENSLVFVSKQNNIIKGDNKNMLMGTYRVAKIKFLEGRNTDTEYCYALFDNEIGIGDTVVVMSAHNGMGIAVVTDIVEEPTQPMFDWCNAGREIIAKFDMSDYENRKENRVKAKKLKSEMDKKIKEMQELALFEMMAEKSPELKEMLETYKGLVN